jgi:hypothetical protein
MPDPRQNVTPRSQRISTGYDPRKPIASKNGVQVFKSPAHASANSRLPPVPSAFSRATKGMSMLGQAPVLLRNMIDTSALPIDDPRFDVSGNNTKQRQQEMNALHLGANTLQDILTMGLGPAAPAANFAIDAAYQANYPAIDEWMRKNIMSPKWKNEDSKNNGNPGINVKGTRIEDPLTALAEFINSPQAMKATVPISNARLPKQLAGYRGHTVAELRPNAQGQPNYGSHVLDLLTDVLNPAGYALTELGSQPVSLASSVMTKRPKQAYNPATQSWEDTKEKSSWSDSARIMRDYVIPKHRRDLGASIRGIGRATQDSFIP